MRLDQICTLDISPAVGMVTYHLKKAESKKLKYIKRLRLEKNRLATQIFGLDSFITHMFVPIST